MSILFTLKSLVKQLLSDRNANSISYWTNAKYTRLPLNICQGSQTATATFNFWCNIKGGSERVRLHLGALIRWKCMTATTSIDWVNGSEAAAAAPKEMKDCSLRRFWREENFFKRVSIFQWLKEKLQDLQQMIFKTPPTIENFRDISYLVSDIYSATLVKRK